MVINGLGELHLRLVLEKLNNRGLHVDTKPPKIAYRETIQTNAEGHHRHKKQTGGAGQFGEVFLRVEPLERGKGFEFVDEDLRRHHPRAVHARRSRKAFARCSTRARSPAIRYRMSV